MPSHYSLSDVSVIIPTYNRAEDLKKTLNALLLFEKELGQIIIVDQSKNDLTKKIVQRHQKKYKNLVYFYSKTPSISISRNLGARHLLKTCKLVCFIDDDVSVGKEYFDEILNVFNTSSEAKGVAGYVHSWLDKIVFIEQLLRKIFFISYKEKNRARIISAYGNTYPYELTQTICTEWLPGVNMVYKREVLAEQQFDEHLLGYTVAEDIDFTYRLHKKYPGSLFITPFAPLIHRVSQVERTPTAKMSYINQVDHFYFHYKNMPGLKNTLIFAWSLFGIFLLRGMNALVTRKKEYFLKFRYFLISLTYCLRNRKIIKQGRVREFLNNL